MNSKNAIAIIPVIISAICGCDNHHADCSHDHAAQHTHVHSAACTDGGAHEHNSLIAPQLQHLTHRRACGTSHDHGEKGNPEAAFVTVAKETQKVMGLKTVQPEIRSVTSTMSFAGRYELNPDARKIAASPVAGRLSLLVRPLATVKKGDALFSVSSPELIARSHEIAALEKRLEVYREIKTPNAALQNELTVKRAERNAMLAGAQEKDAVVTVMATSDGTVESLSAMDGEWLETGAAVIRIVNERDLRFKALVASSDAALLTNGMKAKVGKNPGRIKIGVGDDSGIVPVYVLFDANPDALAGNRDYAQCVTDAKGTPHVAVPSKCIVTINLQPTVFARDPKNPERFIATQVIPGAENGGWTEITALHRSELASEIVCEGAYELKLALAAAGGAKKPAGHFHADGSFHEGEH